MTNGVIGPGSLIQLPIFTAYIDNDRCIGWLAIRMQVDLPGQWGAELENITLYT